MKLTLVKLIILGLLYLGFEMLATSDVITFGNPPANKEMSVEGCVIPLGQCSS